MARIAWRNLCSRPARTILAVLSLTVAIAGMVGLFSIAGGVNQLVASTFERIPGLIVQQPGAPVPLFSSLPADWVDELRAIPGVGVVNPEIIARVNQLGGEPVFSPPRFLIGMDIPSRLQLKHPVYEECLEDGRFFQPSDVGTWNAIISRSIADEAEVAVGDTLDVNGQPFDIVGIYDCGSLMLDVSILLDINQVRRLTRFDPESVSSFYVEAAGGDVRELQERIEQAFRGRSFQRWDPGALAVFFPEVQTSGERESRGSDAEEENPIERLFRDADHRVKSLRLNGEAATADDATDQEAESAVEVQTAADWSERFDEFGADLRLFLTLMTAIAVLIAVFSILNTMLMSVTERTTEFGILRANGWRRNEIVRLIAWESVLIGLGGGVLGGLFGLLATLLINARWSDRIYLYAGPGLLAFAVFFSAAVGLFGGSYPAWRASRLSPMDAIRRGAG